MPDRPRLAALLTDSIDAYLYRFSWRLRGVYLTVLGLVVAGGALLPFLRVEVSARGSGIIRPTVEKQDIRAPVSGLVERFHAANHQSVVTGDTLAVLRAHEVSRRADLLDAKLEESRRYVADLLRMVPVASDGGTSFPRLSGLSPRYIDEYEHFRRAMVELDARVARVQRELERQVELRRADVVTQAEVEDKELEAAQVRAEREAVRQRFVADWQAQLAAARAEARTLTTELETLDEERVQRLVLAPVSGMLEEVTPLSVGAYVQSGDRLAIVSPDTGLVAQVFVEPRDIGLIRPGAPVRLLVDAFRYTEWGYVPGRVTGISGDFVLAPNGTPMFDVQCSLDRTYLVLRNGTRGALKKGMTLQARFTVAQRSLLQILFDDINDWLNPTQFRPRAG